jgi:hypothetical protein
MTKLLRGLIYPSLNYLPRKEIRLKRINRNHRATFFFAVSAVGLVTAWYLNTIAILKAQDYFGAWFGSEVDMVLALDLLITAFAAVPFMFIESKRIGMKNIVWYALSSFITAIAFVFPFWLGMRELHLSKLERQAISPRRSSSRVHNVPVSSRSAKGSIERFEFEGRRIDVWVPENIDELTPLVIAHDGGNFLTEKSETWNSQNWGIQEAIAAGRIAPVNGKMPIFVGVHRIDDSLRMNELIPEDILKAHPELLNQVDPIHRPVDLQYKGNEYQDLLALRLVPEIVRRYSLSLDPSRTAQLGASLGGLATIYGVMRHREVFGTALALSTSWPLGGQGLIDIVVKELGAPGSVRVYSDCGTIELDASYFHWHFKFVEAMDRAGWVRDVSYRAELWPGTGHNETWWGQRVEHPINWWLNS